MADEDGDGWADIEPSSQPPPAPPQPPQSPQPQAPQLASPPPAVLPPTPPWPVQTPPGAPSPPPGDGSSVLPWVVTGALALVVVLLLAVGVAVTSGGSDEGDDAEDRATPATTADDDPEAEAADDDTEAPTTTEPATTASTEPPPPPLPGFDDGTHIVGQDIQPGRYMSTGGFNCYWERRHSVDNGLDGIIVNGNAWGQAVVEIPASDAAFTSDGCDRWVVYSPPPLPATTFADGDWVIGEQIEPGTYRIDSPTSLCTWERASGFTHDYDEFIDYDFQVSPGDTVQLSAGERFTALSCGTWTLI